MERPAPSTSLPPEIVTQVLWRLPDYRTLTQCKSVCKEWRSLISNPFFARTRSPHLSTWRLGKILMWGWGLPPSYITLTTNDDSASNKSDLHLNVGPTDSRPCIAGSCNGILYIQNPNSDALLLNPAMRSSTRIPPHGVQVSTAIATGLGYDHTTDDYKALVIIKKDKSVDIRIFSLRNKLWKKSITKNDLAGCIFRDYDGMTCAYDRKSHSCGTTIDGWPHWTGRRGNGMPVLIRFDMVREEFVDMGLPAELLVRPEKAFEVGELEGMLCVTFKGEQEGTSLEGWSKKNLLDEESSWSKLFSFCPKIGFERMKPVGGDLRGLGQVLMVVMQKKRKVSLTKFNVNHNNGSRFQIINFFYDSGNRAESYAHYIDTPYCPWELILPS